MVSKLLLVSCYYLTWRVGRGWYRSCCWWAVITWRVSRGWWCRSCCWWAVITWRVGRGWCRSCCVAPLPPVGRRPAWRAASPPAVRTRGWPAPRPAGSRAQHTAQQICTHFRVWVNADSGRNHCFGSKYIIFGSGSRNLFQSKSGVVSQAYIINLKKTFKIVFIIPFFL